jgi:hypothetical protein
MFDVCRVVVSDPEVTDLPLPVCTIFVKEFLSNGNANFLTSLPGPPPWPADGTYAQQMYFQYVKRITAWNRFLKPACGMMLAAADTEGTTHVFQMEIID